MTEISVNDLNDDGTVDDIHGTSSWHLEMLDEKTAYFGVGDGAYQFRIRVKDGELTIEPYEGTELPTGEDGTD